MKQDIKDTPWSGKGAFTFVGDIFSWNAEFFALGDTTLVHFDASGGFSLKAIGAVACDLDGFWFVDPLTIPTNNTGHCPCKFDATFGAVEEGVVILNISAKLDDGKWHPVGKFAGEAAGLGGGYKDSHGTLHIMQPNCTTITK